jgi:tetratricopeptide (TPR) repeat protein
MYNNEIEVLKKDHLVCCSSFFSTTYNSILASEYFAGASSSPSSSIDQAVLFEIRSSSFSYKQLKFADISSASNIEDEQEVLFAVGSYFRIENKWFNTETNLWTIELHEMPVKENKEHFNRPFYMDIITIGFYLLITDDDFQSVQRYYNVLLNQANSLLWCISCRVGLGLVEYYKKNYEGALKELQTAIDIINEENLRETCQIIENIYCILANIYREMNNYDMTLAF